MDRAEKKSFRYWIIMLVVVASLAATSYVTVRFLFLQRGSSSNTVGIVRVESSFEFAWAWADVYIDGKWQEVHYYTFHFDVRVENSKTVDTSNLRLVVNLKLKSKMVDSRSRVIGTLKAGESRNIKLDIGGVPHVYLFDERGDSKDIVGIATLRCKNEVLDQKTVTW